MNKIAKGAVAGGLGVLLLLGGGATLAYWNDSETISGAAITAGHLDVAPVAGTAAWTVTNRTVTTGVADIAAFRMVPGDVLTYTQTFNVTGSGQNLRAQVALGNLAIAPVSTSAADVALETRLTEGVAFTVNGASGAGVTLTPTATAQPVVVTATIAWPFGEAGDVTADNFAKNGAVSFTNFAVTVTQVVVP